jgi:hypothetical protein
MATGQIGIEAICGGSQSGREMVSLEDNCSRTLLVSFFRRRPVSVIRN